MQASRARCPRSVAVAFIVMTVAAWHAPGGDDKSSSALEKQIEQLILKLDDDSFAVREAAQRNLIKIGKPSIERLQKAAHAGRSLELSRRARRLIEQIEPGFFPQIELEKERARRRTEIALVSGLNAKNWGEDIANPFTNVTAEGKKKLHAQGIDAARLPSLKAVLITGSYCGANSKTFVNSDPDTVLVLGKGFITHGAVYSVGPVLAIEDAHIMGSLTGADFVWFVDKSFPRFKTTGVPLIAAPGTVEPHERAVSASLIKGDYGWRRPNDFLKLPLVKPGAKLPPLAVIDADNKRKKLSDQIKTQQGELCAGWCKPVVNPFTSLTAEGKAKLRARGIDAELLAKLKALQLTGNYCGAASKTFVNRDPDTILIMSKGFVTHGDVHSLGPILAAEDAHFMGNVTGADLVWFVDNGFPRGTTTGLPVILSPSASHSQMHAGSADVWYGDYGWRRPHDFLVPVDKAKEKKK
jgi:hypothetical protein